MAIDADDQYADVIISYLRHLDTAAADGQSDRRLQVLILSRYNAGRVKVQPALDEVWTHLKVTYSTVHSAKGKEADYVIVVDLTAGGFPSGIEDDPLLAGDAHPGTLPARRGTPPVLRGAGPEPADPCSCSPWPTASPRSCSN